MVFGRCTLTPKVDKAQVVTSVGVGRADYSQSIAQSTEPIIRSWQSGYNTYKTFSVAAGATHTEEIAVQSEYVVIPYDFFLSCYPSSDMSLAVDMYSALGNWVNILNRQGTQCLDFKLAKGWPLFLKWRISVTNLGGAPIDCYFSAHGITTTETQYYGSKNAP